LPLVSVSRSALGPTQSPIQWVPVALSPGLNRGRGVTLTTHPPLVPRSRMSTHWVGGYLRLKAGLDTEARGKIIFLCQGLNLGHPVVQSDTVLAELSQLQNSHGTCLTGEDEIRGG
jgi:hypothetical protein